MLGELIAQGSGKRTNRRILSTSPTTVEVSFESRETILGVPALEIGTYTSVIRPDGTLCGEGQGVFMTMEGEQITWKGSGVGTFREGGSVAYRGAICFQTAAPRFAQLNKVAGAFEFDSDMEGNTQSKLWEWK